MPETAQMAQEWPKWIAGRIAKDRDEARVLLSHTAECGIHATVIVEGARPGAQRLRSQHPDHVLKCTCGGVKPTAADLEAAGLGRGRFNGADPAKFDHDGDGLPGGSEKKS